MMSTWDAKIMFAQGVICEFQHKNLHMILQTCLNTVKKNGPIRLSIWAIRIYGKYPFVFEICMANLLKNLLLYHKKLPLKFIWNFDMQKLETTPFEGNFEIL